MAFIVPDLATEHFGQKIVFHRQLTGLRMQILEGFIRRRRIAPTLSEQLTRVVQQLLLPLGNMIRMHIKFSR